MSNSETRVRFFSQRLYDEVAGVFYWTVECLDLGESVRGSTFSKAYHRAMGDISDRIEDLRAAHKEDGGDIKAMGLSAERARAMLSQADQCYNSNAITWSRSLPLKYDWTNSLTDDVKDFVIKHDLEMEVVVIMALADKYKKKDFLFALKTNEGATTLSSNITFRKHEEHNEFFLEWIELVESDLIGRPPKLLKSDVPTINPVGDSESRRYAEIGDPENWPSKCPNCGRESDPMGYWYQPDGYQLGLCWECDHPHPMLMKLQAAYVIHGDE